MNADMYYDTETGVVGTNMFAYCNNNPVLFLDKNGKSPSLAILTAVGIPTSVFVCIAGILVILVDLTTGGKVILSFSEAIGYLLADVAETVSGVLAAGKIPNKLKTADGKIDLEQFDKKLPGDQGYKGPVRWKIQRDTAGHGQRKRKQYKGAEIIASLYEDGSIADYY